MRYLITKMDIIEKLENTENLNSWSLEEQQKLLRIYLAICKKETHIFDLIWRNHECDSWEDIFRDYDESYLESKVSGVEVAIKNMLVDEKPDSDEEEEDEN